MTGWRDRSDRDFTLPDVGRQPDRPERSPFMVGLAVGAALVAGVWYLSTKLPIATPGPEHAVADLKSWLDTSSNQIESRFAKAETSEAARHEVDGFLKSLGHLREELLRLEARRRAAELKVTGLRERLKL